jgi:PAS domain-containing protein
MFGLVVMLIVETLAIVGLVGLSFYFYNREEQKKQSNKLLIKRQLDLEQSILDARKREEESAKTMASACQWYRNLYNGMQDIVLVHGIGDDGFPEPFLELNDEACRLLGYSREELHEKTIMDVLDVTMPYASSVFSDAKVREHAQSAIKRAARGQLEKILESGQITYEDHFRASDGTKIPVRVHAVRCDLIGQPMIMWVAKDMTALKVGYRALQESERRLQDFFSYSPLGIAMYDADRSLVTVNNSCLRMFGVPDRMEFSRFNLFNNPFLPEDARLTLSRGGSVNCEAVVNFDEVKQTNMFVTTREVKGHFEMLISHLGYDHEFRPRGYFAQIQDVTQRRKVESDLRSLQTMDTAALAEGISGTLEDVGFTDMVQILCVGGKKMELQVTSGKKDAKVYLCDGEIVHCELDRLLGEEAFYKLMKWQSGKFTARPCEVFPERTITTSVMALLMEGARRFDESS